MFLVLLMVVKKGRNATLIITEKLVVVEKIVAALSGATDEKVTYYE